jgi:hypothetical protein
LHRSCYKKQKGLAEQERGIAEVGVTGRAWGFLRRPIATFRAAKEDTLSAALKHALVGLAIFGAGTGLILGALVYLYFAVGGWLFADLPGYLGPPGSGYWFAVPIAIGLSIIGGMLFIFIGGAWIHLWVYLLGGRKSQGYEQTVKALIYGATPGYLVGWVPLIGALVGGIWAVVLTIIGLRELHGITADRLAGVSVLGIGIPVSVTLLCVRLLVGFLYPLIMLLLFWFLSLALMGG